MAIQRLPDDFVYSWYIIIGEFGIAVAFALLARTLRRGSWRDAIVAGIGGGILIFVCYGVAYWITDRLVIWG